YAIVGLGRRHLQRSLAAVREDLDKTSVSLQSHPHHACLLRFPSRFLETMRWTDLVKAELTADLQLAQRPSQPASLSATGRAIRAELAGFLENLPPDQHPPDFAGASADLVELGVTQQPPGRIVVDVAVAAEALDGVERDLGRLLGGVKDRAGRVL